MATRRIQYTNRRPICYTYNRIKTYPWIVDQCIFSSILMMYGHFVCRLFWVEVIRRINVIDDNIFSKGRTTLGGKKNHSQNIEKHCRIHYIRCNNSGRHKNIDFDLWTKKVYNVFIMIFVISLFFIFFFYVETYFYARFVFKLGAAMILFFFFDRLLLRNVPHSDHLILVLEL